MKNICRTIKLRKLKSGVAEEFWKEMEGTEFVVIFDDGKAETWVNKERLYQLLENDHINHIKYIFDSTDRITLDRDIIINTDNM